MEPLSMTFSDIGPGFQGPDIFRSRISQKRCIWGTKLPYRIVPCLV